MENIIKLNINKTANRETEIFTSWKQYTVARAAVQWITSCGQPGSQILIFVVTLYNDLADRVQAATALTVLSGVEGSRGSRGSAPQSAQADPSLLSRAVNQWGTTPHHTTGCYRLRNDVRPSRNFSSWSLIYWFNEVFQPRIPVIKYWWAQSVFRSERRKYQWQRWWQEGVISIIYS